MRIEMKKVLIALVVTAFGLPVSASEKASATGGETATAAELFVNMPTLTLDILTKGMRQDMLDYLKVDSVYNVMNTMEGFSHINLPMTDDFIQVQITPVTLYTIRELPYKGGKIAMTLYTVGDSVQAEDTEIRFYDLELNELKRDKFIKTLSTDDFLNLQGVSGKLKEEIRETVPFPTVKYSIGPSGDTLKAELTVGEFLSKESLEKIAPYMRREREMVWNGSKFELKK